MERQKTKIPGHDLNLKHNFMIGNNRPERRQKKKFLKLSCDIPQAIVTARDYEGSISIKINLKKKQKKKNSVCQ